MIRTTLVFLALLVAGTASAHDIDQIEHTFGATHISAQTGNGGLTVGVAPRGEVTVLSWPSPTFYDQVEYTTSRDEDAREQPFFGAEADQGVFAGLWIEAEGQEGHLLWLRDAEWEVEQAYLAETSAAVTNVHRHADLGLSVSETTFVDVDRDVVLRRAVVKRDEDSSVTSVRYVLYENLAPAATKPDDLATSSLLDQDADHDFLAWWDPEEGALFHGVPRGAESDALGPLMTSSWTSLANWVDAGLPQAVEAAEGDGVFIAIGGATAPDGFQVGRQDRGCDGDDAWTWSPTDAFEDVADGALEGAFVAGCHANAALQWSADLGEVGSPLEVTFDTFWAAGATVDDANDVLTAARIDGYDAALAATDTAWALQAAQWRVPEGLDDEIVHFSRRALLAIIEGMDRDTSATVASVATQPSYHHDWPRDSVFFDLALDLAGEFDAVTDHKAFLASLQNREAVFFEETGQLISPPGAWFMNYYADGAPSTQSLNNFEIDQVGLMLWGFWAHSAFAPNDEARRTALAANWPAMKRGARLLAACVADDHPAVQGTEAPAGHPAWWPVFEALGSGTIPNVVARRAAMEAGDWEAMRPCRANEDDHPTFTTSIYSTVTTRMGLLAAARAAEVLCVDDSAEVEYWRERAWELGATAFALDYDEATGEWSGGQPDWLLWPIPLSIDPSLDELFSDGATAGERRAEVEAFERVALDGYADRVHVEVDDAVNLRTEGAAYENKKTLMLARWWTGDRAPEGDELEANGEHVRQMAVDLPIEGTRHVGEVWASIDDDGDGIYDRADQRVSVPHLWAATLTYLSAMAIARPDLFEVLEDTDVARVCPGGEEPSDTREIANCGSDCQESLAGRTRPGLALLLLGLGLFGARARVRRR